MSSFNVPQFRHSCLVAALLSLSGQSNAVLPEPRQPDNNFNWYNDNVLVNSAYALGVSHWNFLRYYGEAKIRYGNLPPQDQLTNAIVGWDTYISSNIPSVSIFVGDNSPPDNGGGWTVVTPEIPLVNRVVTPVSKTDGFRKPLLPPMRLTKDGRIGVVPGSGGLDGDPQPLRIRLNRPEILNKHFLDSTPGVPTLDPQTWEVADYKKWGLPNSKVTHFASICEGQPKTPAERNPYACGAGGQDDCYNLTLVGSAVQDTFSTSAIYDLKGGYRTLYMPQLESGDRVYSRAMTVRVSQPKTAQARIASVDFSPDYKVAPIRQGVLYELNTPADGRLLVTRRQGLPLVWRHSATGQMRAGSYETVYAVAPDSASPCDASQWGDLRPISHAPFDPLVMAVGTNAEMAKQAALYSNAMHSKVLSSLYLRGKSSASPQHACYMDTPNKDKTAVLHDLPVGSVSIRSNMHFPEGPLYHDAPRPDSTTNEFCLACHSSNDKISGLTVEALRYKNIQAKMDPRRQPTQPPTFITGNIPTEFMNAIKGNVSAVGSQYIDEYMMPNGRNVSPDIRNLVQVQNGQVVNTVSSVSSLARSNFNALRVNASGITKAVWFYVNGKLALDDRSAPFEVSAGSLVNGSNELLVISHANGLQSRRTYNITVSP